MFHKRQPNFLPGVRGSESKTLTGSVSRSLRVLLRTLALGLLVLVVIALPVAAQSTSGSLSGTGKDAKGAAIAGATVEVTGTSRNETRTAQTGEDGRYVFPQLQPDTYKVRVEASGFKRYDLEGLVLSPNDKISAPDIQLEIGAVSENVSVTLQWRAASNRERRAEYSDHQLTRYRTFLSTVAVISR